MIKTILIGRLGADAEVRQIDTEKSVISFSIAVDMGYKNRNGESVTNWYRVAYFVRKSGLAPYLTKGSIVSIEGVPKSNAYISKDNELVQAIEVQAQRVNLIHSNKNNDLPI